MQSPWGAFQDAKPVLQSLLDVATPQPLQLASVETLGQFRDDDVAGMLLEAWPHMTPRVRTAASEVLFSRPSWTLIVFAAIERGAFSLAEVDVGRIQLLARHRNHDIRRPAQRLLARLQLGKRSDVVAEYAAALKTLTGDAGRGKAVFEKNCAACHRVSGVGHEIGPNLTAFAEKGGDAILLNVLDPNREVNPEYIIYQIATISGRVPTGMITSASDNSVTLLRAENVTETILRADIDIELGGIRNTGQSLMPEGLEKLIDHQAMSDLIAYLLAQQQAKP